MDICSSFPLMVRRREEIGKITISGVPIEVSTDVVRFLGQEVHLKCLFWLHCATLLKHSFGGQLPYDLEQQRMVDEEIGVVRSEAIIIKNDEERVGAARFITFGGSWCMVWVYILEEWQRRGILTAAYPLLEQKYGKFSIAPPFSDPMCGFIEKLNSNLCLAGNHAQL